MPANKSNAVNNNNLVNDDPLNLTQSLNVMGVTSIEIGNDESNCEAQIQAMIQNYSSFYPDQTVIQHCITKIFEFIATSDNFCEALIKINQWECIPVDPSGNTPNPTPDPVNVPGAMVTDCLTKLNVLITNYRSTPQGHHYYSWSICIDNCLDNQQYRNLECEEAYFNDEELNEVCESYINSCNCVEKPNTFILENCVVQALKYIDENLLPDFSNACAVYQYVIDNFDCFELPPIEDPGPPYYPNLPDDWVDNGVVNNVIIDGPYNEYIRQPIWWYHTDHLGSSTYLTDNFGRPTHFYETLPFGEVIVEENQSVYYRQPLPTNNVGTYDNAYKFNGKELDAATGMYYYGARYYDPRISIFVSVDPLAEQFVGWTPYHYVHNNPINLIDPTGMNAEGLENGPPLKNIVINFLRDEKGDSGGPLGNFDNKDMARNGWHVIDVSSIEEANTKLTEYLGGSKADNIFINAHGGTTEYRYGDGTLADESSGINLGGTNVTGRSLQLYNEGKMDELQNHHSGAKQAIEALQSISGMINDGKNLIFGSCNTGIDDRVGQYISQMNPNIDVFLSKDLYNIEHSGKTKTTSFQNFTSPAIRRQEYRQGISRFKGGKLQETGINIQMNNTNGVRIIRPKLN